MYVCMRPAKNKTKTKRCVVYGWKEEKKVCVLCVLCVCVCGLATCMRWNLDLMMNCDLIRINQWCTNDDDDDILIIRKKKKKRHEDHRTSNQWWWWWLNDILIIKRKRDEKKDMRFRSINRSISFRRRRQAWMLRICELRKTKSSRRYIIKNDLKVAKDDSKKKRNAVLWGGWCKGVERRDGAKKCPASI